VHIDTEWRSDWKWERLHRDIDALDGRRVLDVGCGSGYHCWRMAGDGAAEVVGIDPTPLFVVQFWALQKYLQQDNVWVLPLGIEHVPTKLQAFDTVFSMGVLYHRRSPFDHLQELKDCLRPGGQLVLETLVIEGELGDTLLPEGRYARMGNVWFLPSCDTLLSWLRKLGFVDPQLVDVCVTTTQEQRSTPWMTFHSLANFLDPDDASKSIEGHPAPRRAIVTARAPG
jgi:tRNA (mo5U34)-methyltransferase